MDAVGRAKCTYIFMCCCGCIVSIFVEHLCLRHQHIWVNTSYMKCKTTRRRHSVTGGHLYAEHIVLYSILYTVTVETYSISEKPNRMRCKSHQQTIEGSTSSIYGIYLTEDHWPSSACFVLHTYAKRNTISNVRVLHEHSDYYCKAAHHMSFYNDFSFLQWSRRTHTQTVWKFKRKILKHTSLSQTNHNQCAFNNRPAINW